MSTEDYDDDDELLDEESDDDMFKSRERSRHSSRVVGDFVRRAIDNTLGQVQSSGGLPKDALHYLIQQGDKGRKEIVRIVATEVGDFLKHTDVSSEVVKILTNVQVDMNASIRFKRNPEGKLSSEIEEGSGLSISGLEQPEPEVEPEPEPEDKD